MNDFELTQPFIEAIGIAVMLLSAVILFFVAKEEINYQKLKIKSTDTENDKQLFIENVIKNWWCRNRFLKDLKKGRFVSDLTPDIFDYITVNYRTNKSDENLKRAKQELLVYV